MTKQPISALTAFTVSAVVIFLTVIHQSHAYGSDSTLAIASASTTATVCGLVSAQPRQRIACYRRGQVTSLDPNISFSAVSGGETTVCGLRSGGYSLLCWDNLQSQNSTFQSKRLYFNSTFPLDSLSVGDHHICARVAATAAVKCWRTDDRFVIPSGSERFSSISSGLGFTCGILSSTSQVRCWGASSIANRIQTGFENISMATIEAGGSHACGLNATGMLVCKGSNDSGQLNSPPETSPFEYFALSLGTDHSCAIRKQNHTVICWGGGGGFSGDEVKDVSFETIASGSNFTCGLTTRNFSVICWGPGWPNISGSTNGSELNLPEILPGPCVQSDCAECGVYPQSQTLCGGSGNICKPCLPPPPAAFPPPPPPPPAFPPPPSISPPSPPSKALTTGLLVFAIVGSVGAFAGVCTVVYCIWTGVCFGDKKIHNSVQPTITRAASSNNGATSNNSPPSRSSTIRRQGSRIMRRQRSGTSSIKHADRAEEFSLAELAAATNNFSLENKIGAGSFGVVYRGKLPDGREVAVKRGETGSKLKKFQEKESAFDSELAFLSRVHHKHLVRLVGYCEEKEERLLVYEHMKNGALYDHLHDKNNAERTSSLLNSWRVRIKVALDAARGIEYLHNYAVPPIIHRDIKSSNILLDSNWTARVSDFGLSLLWPEIDTADFRPMKAAGTVGYIDPEYYGLNLLTAKSDVYGLGVVLLELLTGKRAIFKDGENGGTPISVVDFAVPAIMAGELERVLDKRVGPPAVNEAEAVELVAYTAMHCVNMEGKDRPTMADIVANLERAFTLCDDSHGSISSGTISIVSAE